MKKCIILWSVLFGLTAQALAAPETLLHLSFENDRWVEFARNGEEIYSDYPNRVTGHTGNGASIKERGECGTIAAKGNINKAHGTISFWYKPDASVNFAEEPCGFFSNGLWRKKTRNCLSIWTWPYKGGKLRFNVDRRIYATADATPLIPGKWVYLVFTWDHTKRAAIYINGKLEGERLGTWDLVEFPEMNIGQMLSTGLGMPLANGVMDEFKIYSEALTTAQVLKDYRGTFKAPNATQVIPQVEVFEKKRTLKISFDHGLDADEAEGNPVVKLKGDVKHVKGLRGRGAAFGSTSFLQYDSGPNISHRAGTVSLWMKTSWEPWGNGFPVGNGDINVYGDRHLIFLSNSGKNNLKADMGNLLRLTDKVHGTNVWTGVNRQVMKNTWHHYVFTWDSPARKATIYLDGKKLRTVGNFIELEEPFDMLRFGRRKESIQGVLDEIAVYNWPLQQEDVMALYAKGAGLSVDLLDYAAFSGQKNDLRLLFSNNSDKKVSGKQYKIDIVAADGSKITSSSQTVSLAVKSSTTRSLSWTPPADGLYRVNLTVQGVQLRSFELLAITEADLHSAKNILKPGEEGRKTLLQTIDCTQPVGTEKYRDDGAVSVVKSSIGSYREAKNLQNSGFAYKVDPLPNPGQPHWLEITYPDNADRTFMVVLFQEFNGHIDAKGLDTMGVITGVDHPITGRMQVKRMLFWPDNADIMVGCYGYHPFDKQAGPALAEIKIYEATGPLPKRQIGSLSGAPVREIGVWQEDPSMTAACWFNQDSSHPNVTLENFWKKKWNRIVEYLDYSGQNLWHMMLTGYKGDNGLNSNQIATSRRLSENGRLPGWADVGALMLESKGIAFYASINNRLTSSGDEGSFYKMIPSNYHRTASSMRDLLEGDANASNRKWIVDCIASDDYYTGSYNPLHPVVQAAYQSQVRAYAQRFGKYDNFGGVTFLAVKKSSLFFHSLEEGYSDINIEQFEQDTGIDVPETTNRRRFSARRNWLFSNAKSKWLNWRCKRIRDFYKSLAAIIREYNPDAKLVISLQLAEPFDVVNKKWPEEEGQLARYWRECGIDFDLYTADSDIVLTQAITPYRGRIYGHTRSYDGTTNRYDNFNPEVSALVADHVQRSAWISLHSNLEFLPGTTQRIPNYWTSFGSWNGKTNGPIHAFANVIPSREFILEFMTDILAHNDAKRIIHGWWGSPDNGNIEEFSRFYAAYRSIPAYDFLDLPDADDPVKVRYYNTESDAYVYFVNQLSCSAKCTLQMKSNLALRSTHDGAAQSVVPAEEGYAMHVTLQPYQVLCLTGTGTITPTNFSTLIPKVNIEEIREAIQALSVQYKKTTATGEEHKRIKATCRRIMEAYRSGRYAEVQHLLQSAPVYKNAALGGA